MSRTCMLVDDEPYIRLILRKVIEKTEGFTVTAECGNMAEALLAFPDVHPDIVFMDIDLQGNSGIDCARIMLKQNPDLILIFATAYAEYMPDAFELYAFDYLVKPFNVERIRHTLERIRRQKPDLPENAAATPVSEEEASGINGGISMAEDSLIAKGSSIAEGASIEERVSMAENAPMEMEALPGSPRRLMLKKKDSIEMVDIDDIIMVAHEKTTTRIYTEKQVFETSRSISELEKKLPEPEFMRCHRSYLIRTSRIKSMEPYGRWTYLVRFDGIQADALMTKDSFDRLKEWYE